MNKTSWTLLATTVFFASLAAHLYFKLDVQREQTATEFEARNEAVARAKKAELATASAQDEAFAAVRAQKGQPTAASGVDREQGSVAAADKSLSTVPATAVAVKTVGTTRTYSAEEMNSTPEGKAARREMFRDTIDRMYGDFPKEAKLNAEDTARFMELILNRVANGQPMRVSQDDPELRNILDTGQLAQLDEYQKTLSERQQVSQLRSQLASRRIGSMSEDQERRLFSALIEERATYKPPIPANFNSREEFLADFARWQNEFERRALERAQQVLAPEQYEVLRRQVESQARMRVMASKDQVTTVKIP